MVDVTLSLADAQDLVSSILQRHNSSADNAQHVGRALIAAEIDGQRGHGLSRVPSYAAQSASGKVDGFAMPMVLDRKRAAVRIDAANGFAFPAFDLVISELKTLASDAGIAVASVFATIILVRLDIMLND